MTDARAALAQVREALAAGPTPGEWRYVFDDGDRTIVAAETSQSFMCDTEYYPWCPANEADWKLIAACCPPNMSAILAHVETQEAENERMTEENRRLRADLLAGRNVVNAGLTIHTLTIERDMLRQEIERLTAALNTCVWALRQPLDDWKGECERKALDEAREALKEQR